MERARTAEAGRRSAAAAARAGHAHRVALWCAEVGQAFSLDSADLHLLQRASLLHQYPRLIVNDAAVARLMADMGIPQTPLPEADREVVRLLAMFEGHGPSSDARMARLAAILEMCDAFDETFETEALAPGQEGGQAVSDAREVLCSMLQGSCRADLLNVIDRLPVFPVVAQRALLLLGDENCSYPAIEKLVASDAVLAVRLIEAANSAAFGGSAPVSTIRAALMRTGIEIGRRIVISASMQPMFASRRLQALWNHSIDVAATAASVARDARNCDPEEAFLAGLTHDIGRLMILRLPADAASRYVRLLDGGCPHLLAEIALFGHNHAELGGQALERWKFAPPIITGVAHHHAPEETDSVIASVLYLSEECAGSVEDLPSAFRLRRACDTAGLRFEQFLAVSPRLGAMSTLRYANQTAL